jgi:hypothetical protein
MRIDLFIYSLAFIVTSAITVAWPRLAETGRTRVKNLLAPIGLAGILTLFGVAFYNMFAVSIPHGLLLIGLVGVISLANKLAYVDEWWVLVEHLSSATQRPGDPATRRINKSANRRLSDPVTHFITESLHR